MTITDLPNIPSPTRRDAPPADDLEITGDTTTARPPTPPQPLAAGARPWDRVTKHGWITAAIAAVTTVLYTWNLSANGDANDYYAAAVKSMSVSWKAFFYGSIDSGSFITVDKPPAALWLQALSVRAFGFNSWAMLLPEVLAGVASVLILHRLVRTWAGDIAAHLAAVAFALTPVAALMFRFNNPDALLTFLCLAAAWGVWAALESGRTRGLVVSAVLIGFAFNTKMLQALVVVPAFILVYLVAGKPRLRTRVLQLVAALATLLVSAGWWVAIVTLTPASDRPYIGGSDTNSVLELIFGYNGLARVFGNSSGGGPAGGGGGGGPSGGSGFGGTVGWLRMFNTENGGQISWLIPMALAGLAAGLWLTRRAARTDLVRAGWLLWGSWAVVGIVLFSKAQGIFHSYYTVQLAPAVAALAGAGAVSLWRLGRRHRFMAWALPVTILVSAAWAVALLQRTAGYDTWLVPVIVVSAVAAVVGLWLGTRLRSKVVVIVAAVLGSVALLAGPAAYTLTTVTTSYAGSIVQAGPQTSTRGAGGPGAAGGATGAAGAAGAAGGGPGASEAADPALVQYLEANQGEATYIVAAFSSHASAPIIMATDQPVMTIGGFNGSDPAPTLAQFQDLVASGAVRYVLVSSQGTGGPGGAGGPGGGGSSSISSWVTANGTVVEGVSSTAGTLYDLAALAPTS